MKIAVFGDSFADKKAQQIWWKYLQEFGHTVVSFGECGSSIAFSAGELWTHHRDFDFSIWCVSSSNRVSFYHKDVCHHVTNAFDHDEDDSDVASFKHIAQQYLEKTYHPHGHEVLNHYATKGVVACHDNVMLIPCFATPIDFMAQSRFNLYQLSTLEAQFYFPKQDLYNIYKKYTDCRQGHFTKVTHETLAEKINTSINDGTKVFCADYTDFPVPIEPLASVFCLR